MGWTHVDLFRLFNVIVSFKLYLVKMSSTSCNKDYTQIRDLSLTNGNQFRLFNVTTSFWLNVVKIRSSNTIKLYSVKFLRVPEVNGWKSCPKINCVYPKRDRWKTPLMLSPPFPSPLEHEWLNIEVEWTKSPIMAVKNKDHVSLESLMSCVIFQWSLYSAIRWKLSRNDKVIINHCIVSKLLMLHYLLLLYRV